VIGWAVVVFVVCWMIVFPLWMWRRRGGQARHPVPSAGRIIREFLLALPFLLLVLLVLTIVAAIIQGATGEPAETPGAWRHAATAPGGWRLVVLAVVFCAVGPVAEEVFFRWFLFRGLRKWWGGFAAALGQAALFALYHPYGVKRLVIIFVAGLMLQKIYLWRRTLLAPVFVHALFNALAFATALYVASQPKPRLGVRCVPDASKCVIEEVMPESGAAKAGLRPGDVITSFDGRPVTSVSDLRSGLQGKDVGDRVRIGILRNSQALTVDVVLGRRPSAQGPP
jgi:membrane protease YdiL (CAAX protease family)